jgi:hypothetical protein
LEKVFLKKEVIKKVLLDKGIIDGKGCWKKLSYIERFLGKVLSYRKVCVQNVLLERNFSWKKLSRKENCLEKGYYKENFLDKSFGRKKS